MLRALQQHFLEVWFVLTLLESVLYLGALIKPPRVVLKLEERVQHVPLALFHVEFDRVCLASKTCCRAF